MRSGAGPSKSSSPSTGVIGHQLPGWRSCLAGFDAALGAASASEPAYRLASQAIMTTDSRPKLVSKRQEIGGAAVSLLGLAKGAAMIGPRMATMLAFLLILTPGSARARPSR